MPKSLWSWRPGPDRRSVTLNEGAVIVGHLVQNGKPVPNAQIGLIHKDDGGFNGDLVR